VWKKFGAKVGWYHPEKNDWRTYTEFMSDTKNAQNSLPASLPKKFYWIGDVVGGGVSLLSRRDL
jgi:hypothetical protein